MSVPKQRNQLPVTIKSAPTGFVARTDSKKKEKSTGKSKKRRCSAKAKLSLALLFLLVLTKYLSRDENGNTCPVSAWTQQFQCRHLLTLPQAPTLRDEWIHFRRVYQQVIGKEASTLDKTWETGNNGFLVPIDIQNSSGKGRGVHVTIDVVKGQKLWTNLYTARLPSACAVRKYLQALSNDHACDMIRWGCNFDYKSMGHFEWAVFLDEAILINEVDWSQLKQGKNIEFRFSQTRPRDEPGALQMFAKQDIPAGTELIADYTDYHKETIGFAVWWETLFWRSWGYVGH